MNKILKKVLIGYLLLSCINLFCEEDSCKGITVKFLSLYNPFAAQCTWIIDNESIDLKENQRLMISLRLYDLDNDKNHIFNTVWGNTQKNGHLYFYYLADENQQKECFRIDSEIIENFNIKENKRETDKPGFNVSTTKYNSYNVEFSDTVFDRFRIKIKPQIITGIDEEQVILKISDAEVYEKGWTNVFSRDNLKNANYKPRFQLFLRISISVKTK